MSNFQSSSFRGGALVALGASLWATDTFFRSFLTGHYSIFYVVFITQLLSSIVCLPILYLLRAELQKIDRKDLYCFLFIALCSNTLAMLAFTHAFSISQNYNIPVLIQKTQPFFAMASALYILKEKLPSSYPIFFALALVGSFLMATGDASFHLTGLQAEVIGYSLAASLMWGVGTTFGRRLSLKLTFWTITSLRYVISTAFLMATLPFVNFEFASIRTQDLLPFVALAFIPGLAALFIYYAGLKKTTASTACLFELSFPLTVLLINYAAFDMSLSGFQILGCCFLVFSVTILGFVSAKKSTSVVKISQS